MKKHDSNRVIVEIIIPRTSRELYNIDFDFEIGDEYEVDEDVAIEAFEGAIKEFNETIIDPPLVPPPDVVHWPEDEKPSSNIYNFKRQVEVMMSLGSKSVESYSLSLVDKYPPSLDAIFSVFKLYIKCFREISSEFHD